MRRWIQRGAVIAVAGLLAVYAGDWAVFKLRGSPTSIVTVNKFMSVPLKGNKIEYDFVGTTDMSCSASLFPRSGLSACWRLRRNLNQTQDL